MDWRECSFVNLTVSICEQQTETQPGSLDTATQPHKMLASPAVRRIIRENNLDPSLIQTSLGKSDRILKEDVLNFIKKTGADKAISHQSSHEVNIYEHYEQNR